MSDFLDDNEFVPRASENNFRHTSPLVLEPPPAHSKFIHGSEYEPPSPSGRPPPRSTAVSQKSASMKRGTGPGISFPSANAPPPRHGYKRSIEQSFGSVSGENSRPSNRSTSINHQSSSFAEAYSQVKREILSPEAQQEASPLTRPSRRRSPNRSSSRNPPSASHTSEKASAEKKLANFKAAERAGRTICVCGASAYYERERFTQAKEKQKLREEQAALREDAKAVKEAQRGLKDELYRLEQKTKELELQGRALERRAELIAEEEGLLEMAKETNQKLRDQIERDREVMESREADLTVREDNYRHNMASLDKMLSENKQRRMELDERTQSLRKAQQKLEQSNTRIQLDSERLMAFKCDLSAVAEKNKEREAELDALETNLEEKRRGLMAMEGRLNAELSAVEDRVQALNEREEALKELEDREAEFSEVQRRTLMDLEHREKELEEREANYEAARARNMEALEQEKSRNAKEMTLAKEDCESFVRLEREWIAQEKEGIENQKRLLANELKEEREHAEQMVAQLRKRTTELIEQEKLEWKREQSRMIESRNRQKAEFDKLRDELDHRQERLTEQRKDLERVSEEVDAAKMEFESVRDSQNERIRMMKEKLDEEMKNLEEKRQNLLRFEQDLKRRQIDTENRQHLVMEAERRLQDVAAREKALEAAQQRHEEASQRLKLREQRLTDAEKQAGWMQSLFKEVNEKEKHLELRGSQLDWERQSLEEARRLVMNQQKRVQELMVSNRKEPESSGIQSGMQSASRRPGRYLSPQPRVGAHRRADSGTRLPPLQVAMATNARKKPPVINVPDDDDDGRQSMESYQCASQQVKESAERSHDMRSTDMRSTDMRSTDMRSTDMRSTDMRSTDMRSTDMRSTDIRSSDIRSSDMRSSDKGQWNRERIDDLTQEAEVQYDGSNLMNTLKQEEIQKRVDGPVSDGLCLGADRDGTDSYGFEYVSVSSREERKRYLDCHSATQASPRSIHTNWAEMNCRGLSMGNRPSYCPTTTFGPSGLRSNPVLGPLGDSGLFDMTKSPSVFTEKPNPYAAKIDGIDTPPSKGVLSSSDRGVEDSDHRCIPSLSPRSSPKPSEPQHLTTDDLNVLPTSDGMMETRLAESMEAAASEGEKEDIDFEEHILTESDKESAALRPKRSFQSSDPSSAREQKISSNSNSSCEPTLPSTQHSARERTAALNSEGLMRASASKFNPDSNITYFMDTHDSLERLSVQPEPSFTTTLGPDSDRPGNDEHTNNENYGGDNLPADRPFSSSEHSTGSARLFSSAESATTSERPAAFVAERPLSATAERVYSIAERMSAPQTDRICSNEGGIRSLSYRDTRLEGLSSQRQQKENFFKSTLTISTARD